MKRADIVEVHELLQKMEQLETSEKMFKACPRLRLEAGEEFSWSMCLIVSVDDKDTANAALATRLRDAGLEFYAYQIRTIKDRLIDLGVDLST